jgi:hypothetical protein
VGVAHAQSTLDLKLGVMPVVHALRPNDTMGPMSLFNPNLLGLPIPRSVQRQIALGTLTGETSLLIFHG